MSLKSPKIQLFGTVKLGPISPSKVPFRERDVRTRPVLGQKREQLESLLEREKTKAKRDRIGHVLIQKLIDKFGSKNKPIITFFVDEFLNSNDKITSEDLNALEKEVINAINAKNTSTFQTKNSTDSDNNITTNQNNPEESNRAKTPAPPPGTEWVAIMTYNNIIAEEKERKEKEKLRNDKVAFKKNLEDHIQKSKDLKGSDKFQDKNFAEYIKKDVEKYHIEEQKKQAAIKKRYHDELELQKLQIKDHQRRLEQEREELRKAEEYNLQLAREALEKENQKILNIKKREQDNQKIVSQENEENKRYREIQKKLEADEDQRLMREYAAKLDREASERENMFKKKMEEMAKHGSKFETDGAGKVMREERLREEQLLLKEQKKKEEDDLAKELKKKEDSRIRQQLAMVENQRQIEEKKKAADKAKEADMALSEKYKNDSDSYKKDMDNNYRNLKEKRLNYREVLYKQMDDGQKLDKNLTGISAKEKELNKSILDKVTKDPLVMSRVMHRVRLNKPSTAGATSSSRAPF